MSSISAAATNETPPHKNVGLLSLPRFILAYVIAPFLADHEIVSSAICSKSYFSTWHETPYHIKRQLHWLNPNEIPLYKAIPFAWSATSPIPSLRLGQLRLIKVLGPRTPQFAPDPVGFTTLIASIPPTVHAIEIATGGSWEGYPFNLVPFPAQITDLDFSMSALPPAGPPLPALPPNLLSLSLPRHNPPSNIIIDISWKAVVQFPLPQSIHTLNLGGSSANRSLKNFVYPPNLTELNTGEWHGSASEFADSPLPASLLKLSIPFFAGEVRVLTEYLPSGLTELAFCEVLKSGVIHTGWEPFTEQTLQDIQWPKSLRVLRLGLYAGPLSDWHPPSELETLELVRGMHLLSEMLIPPKLKELTFSSSTNSFPRCLHINPTKDNPIHLRSIHLDALTLSLPVLRSQWPAGLVALDLNIHAELRYDEIDHDGWPPMLRKLRFGNFNQPVDQLRLPHSLKWLGFGAQFNQPVDRLKLPPELEVLHLCSGAKVDNFKQSLKDLVLPDSLRSFFVPYCNDLPPTSELPHRLPASLLSLHRFDSFQCGLREADAAAINLSWSNLIATVPRCALVLYRPKAHLDFHNRLQEISWKSFQ